MIPATQKMEREFTPVESFFTSPIASSPSYPRRNLRPGLCKRCVMMLQCNPVIGPNGRHFFLGIDMSMPCADDGLSLESGVGTAAIIFLLVTILIPGYGSRTPTPRVPAAVRT